MKKVAIIGAGSSGLMLASYLNRYSNIDVVIFERNNRPGRKLLATGNGKCNLANSGDFFNAYNNKDFVEKVFAKVSLKDVLNYFQELGLVLKEDEEKRIYPYANSSLTVLNILLDSLSSKTKIIYDYEVTQINKLKDGFCINNNPEIFDYVVGCSGSIASIPVQKQSAVYRYLKHFDIKKPQPSLVGFKVQNNVKKISGVRLKAVATLFNDGQEVYQEFGEIIFKDDGISGIVVMNLSSYFQRIQIKRDVYISLNLLPNLELSFLKEYQKKYPDLTGLLHPKFVDYYRDNSLKLEDILRFNLKVIDVYDFENAQVVSGGVSTEVLNEKLEIDEFKKMFLCGEVMDVDGVCGGYNLMFAFASAILVAKEIVKDEITN